MNKDANDPLAQFRGGATNPGTSQSPSRRLNASAFPQISQSASTDYITGDPHFYTAFGTGDRSQERLEIRQVLGAWHAPSYRYLMDIVFNARQGTELVLTYSFLLVKIKGRNMQPIITALLEGTCAFIQDYHKNEFTPPAANAPVITEIEIVMKKE